VRQRRPAVSAPRAARRRAPNILLSSIRRVFGSQDSIPEMTEALCALGALRDDSAPRDGKIVTLQFTNHGLERVPRRSRRTRTQARQLPLPARREQGDTNDLRARHLRDSARRPQHRVDDSTSTSSATPTDPGGDRMPQIDLGPGGR